MSEIIQWVRLQIQTKFLLRWTLANALGWSLGLFAGALALRLLGGLGGLLVGGALAGAVAGGTQNAALRQEVAWIDRRWVLVSAAGAALGVLPAFVAGVSLIAGWMIGLLIVGAVFGAIFGMGQWLVLRSHVHDAAWWIAANGLAAALCALLSLGANPFSLPILLTLGPLTFGLVTGYALRRLQADDRKK